MRRLPAHGPAFWPAFWPALAFLLAGLSASAAAAQLPECRAETLHLRGDWGMARLNVELADSAAERARGLMGRPAMPASSGMLFVFERTAPVAFWMKDTLIPLDMVFVDAGGRVTHVHHRAAPHDLTPIPSRGPVRYVLEVRGGLASALGLSVGTELRHPSISQAEAVWPCEVRP
ncbi:DUF192 domain-containing protein [Shimia sp.]|uniref:DUF192 domain-containing protein n=1 Tax=Shimia sp. TaxID=1954381 RepID=UPI00356305E2